MSALRGDFIGFTYNGVHSSELGIVRVSDGSRFNENLLPNMNDKTVQVSGGEGTLFFGSEFTQRPITISFAFDGLTEQQLHRMQVLFGDKKIHDLIFDERPYKAYQAKVTGTSSIKYIPFSEEGLRIYKGEGTIQFTCYQPYAICSKKFLSDYSGDTSEWASASGLKNEQGNLDVFNTSAGGFSVYNPGDKPSDWLLNITSTGGQFQDLIISIDSVGYLEFKGCEAKGIAGNKDSTLIFNSKNRLIEGRAGSIKSGNIYNEFIVRGDFFDIPQTKEVIQFNVVSQTTFSRNPQLKYNYYYF